MEPKINYGNTGLPPDLNSDNKVHGRSKFKGCAIISIIIILVILAGASYMIYRAVSVVKDISNITKKIDPSDQKNPITSISSSDSRFEGIFMDAVVIPQNDGNPKIWILTDASKTFIETRKRAGYYSTGASCVDCKTKVYTFDPASDKILSQTENKFGDIITESNIFNIGGKTVQFTRGYGNNPPTINAYDASTGDMISDTKDFLDKHEELKSGLVQLYYSSFSGTVSFDTKDGQKNLIYSPVNDKIYKDSRKLDEDLAEITDGGTGNICALRSDNSSDKRYKLWRITAPKKDIILNKSSYLSYPNDPSHLKMVNPDATTEMVSNKVYLQGIIYYQDDETAVIIYVDEAGKTANRIMTCIDIKTGKEKWTANHDALFSYMKIDETKNTNTGFESTRDKIRVKKSGNIITLMFIAGGITGFDYETGKKLWSLEVHS